MKLLDQNTSDCFKVPELVLMEQAAMNFVEKLLCILGKENKKGIVFCGLGNNGADGIAIARLLNERGIYTEICKIKDILSLSDKTTDSYGVQEDVYKAYGYPIQTSFTNFLEKDYDFVIDAIFGVGLSRNLSDEYISIINNINKMSGIKIAVDIPSGIHSDNGQIMGAAVKCHYTITFSFEKLGQYLWPGSDYAGENIVASIGITNRSWLDQTPSMAYLEEQDLYHVFKRPDHSNKGTFGKLLIIAGSANMAGAAILSARAAYRCGVGLVKVFTSVENRFIIQTSVPEVIVETYDHDLNINQVIENIKWADAIVIGPGIGQSDTSKRLVEIVQKNAIVPVLWDADALNILSLNKSKLLLPQVENIVTPHLGEFSRMTAKSVSWIQNHVVECAIDYARSYNVTCVLKDFHTVIASPKGMNYLNLSGNNGMATAGSGDVLTGIIGAFMAQGYKSFDAAAYGVFIHGLAGDCARDNMGTYAIMASDIIEGLKYLWKKVDENAE